jgi:hypothetical protein
MPSQIAAAHGGVNKKNMETILHALGELFQPMLDRMWYGPGGTYSPYARSRMERIIADAVTLQLRMLGSRQKFEVRMVESNEKIICLPDLYSHSAEDGMPLDEPKLWYEGKIQRFDEKEESSSDGDTNSIIEMENAGELQRRAGRRLRMGLVFCTQILDKQTNSN